MRTANGIALLCFVQSTSNASSGYESGLATNRQSSPISSSVRTGSGSSITSEASTSSCYYNSKNGTSHVTQRLSKISSNDNDIDADERQRLSLTAVGGYVDDLMERVRKMPPKKRSKFYQLLDEERLKDVNNNNPDEHSKPKPRDCDDDDDNEPVSMNVSMPLATDDMNSDDDEDRTIIEISPNAQAINDDVEDKTKQLFMGLNEKSYEELLSLGVPLSVLKAIALQHQQQAHSHSNAQLSNFLNSKCTVSSSNSPADNKRLLSARTILRRILQQHQKEQQQQRQNSTNDKSLPEPMDYMSDEEGGPIEDDDDHEEPQSSSNTPRHRNGVRSNSHNPVTVMLNRNEIASLSPPTSTSSSPDETDVNHQSSPNSISRPSSTPAALVSSACSF